MINARSQANFSLRGSLINFKISRRASHPRNPRSTYSTARNKLWSSLSSLPLSPFSLLPSMLNSLWALTRNTTIVPNPWILSHVQTALKPAASLPLGPYPSFLSSAEPLQLQASILLAVVLVGHSHSSTLKGPRHPSMYWRSMSLLPTSTSLWKQWMYWLMVRPPFWGGCLWLPSKLTRHFADSRFVYLESWWLYLLISMFFR